LSGNWLFITLKLKWCVLFIYIVDQTLNSFIFFLQNVTEEIGDSIRNKVLYIKNCSHSIFIIIIVKIWTALYINYDSMIFFRKFRIIPSICTHKLLYNEWKVVLLPIIFQIIVILKSIKWPLVYNFKHIHYLVIWDTKIKVPFHANLILFGLKRR
jgi:hypothetical protein